MSDDSTNRLDIMFNTPAGKRVLAERGVDPTLADMLVDFGYSSICNTLAAITAAKAMNLGPDDVVMSVATDGSDLYNSDRERIMSENYAGGFEEPDANDVFENHLAGLPTEHMMMGDVERNRVFNLGYYTWVEQQGVDIPDFEARRDQQWWGGLRSLADTWDGMITDFNQATGASFS